MYNYSANSIKKKKNSFKFRTVFNVKKSLKLYFVCTKKII